MTRHLSITALGLLLCCGYARARELREYSLEEKIRTSELIFVGNAIELEQPVAVEGVDAFVAVRVIEALKGTRAGDELRFVVQGVVAEANPDCCVVGGQYLFFAVKGAQVFTVSENAIEGALDHKEQFVSAANGPFSTYLVVSDTVRSWPVDGTIEDTPLPAIRSAIKAQQLIR